MRRARCQGAAFLFGDAFVDPHYANFLAVTSFSGHEGGQSEEPSVTGETKEVFENPAALMDPYEWVKIASVVATVGNFVALCLTFVAAAYHAYGYVQYKRAVEQQANAPDGHGHGHSSDSSGVGRQH